MVKAREIIGAGFGRAGSRLLSPALERPGFDPRHAVSEMIDSPGQIVSPGRGRRSPVRLRGDLGWLPVSGRFSCRGLPAGAARSAAGGKGHPARSRPRGLAQQLFAGHPAAVPRRGPARPVPDDRRGDRRDRTGLANGPRRNPFRRARKCRVGPRPGAPGAPIFRAQDGRVPPCANLGAAVPVEPYPKTTARADFLAREKSGTAEPAH